MKPRTRKPKAARKGSIVVLACALMVVMLGMVAFAVDLGYLTMAQTELQRAADATSLAATWELIDRGPLGEPIDLSAEIIAARDRAVEYANLNNVCNETLSLDANTANSTDGDVLIGYLSDPSDPTCEMTFSDPNRYNAVRIRVSRTSVKNGQVPLFFARIFGQTGRNLAVDATSAVVNSFDGFKAPSNGDNLGILPLTLDEETWNWMLAGGGSDNWTYEATTGEVIPGTDGVREINLYPQGTGSPGNRGTVDIGPSDNSTSDLSRQILYGVSEADLSYFPNGELKFDENGFLYLNGDTGISAGIKDELTAIIGRPKMIPIFREVTANGDNATYTIVKWVGIRVLDVKLTGSMSTKRVTIQPSRAYTLGGIPSTSNNRSDYIYSNVWLVR